MAGLSSLPGQLFLQAPSDRLGHEIFDGSIEDLVPETVARRLKEELAR